MEGRWRGAPGYLPALAERWVGPGRRFVIVTVGRTGSELLVDLLDHHPHVVCEGEILASPRRLPRQYIQARAARAGWRGARAYGWKLLTGQFPNGPGRPDAPGLIARLVDHGHRIVLLERRDHLQQAISWYRALNGRFHYRRGEEQRYVPVEIDPALLEWAAAANRDASDLLRRAVGSAPHLRLVYEDDLLDPADHQATLDRVCRLLDVLAAPAITDHIKIAPRRTSELVSNWDQVVAWFERAGQAGLLDPRPAGS